MTGTGRRVLVVLAVAATLVVVVAGLVAFRRDPPPVDAAPRIPAAGPVVATGVRPGRWSPLPPSPLPVRWGAVGAWTGREVLVIGGSSGPPCLRGCDPGRRRRDGAAYDPATRTWRRLPPAPYPIGPGAAAAATSDQVVVTTGRRWLVLDLRVTGAGRWRVLPGPGLGATDLTAAAGRVYAFDRNRRGAVLDVTRSVWRRLPALRQVNREARPVAFPGGVALVGGATAPRYVATPVRLWNGASWRRVKRVSPGRLDPATGAWLPLPAPPGRAGAFWLGLPETDGRPATSGEGHVWDPRRMSWVGLGRPETPATSYGTVVYAAGAIYTVGGLPVDGSGAEDPMLGRHAWVWTP